MKIGQFISLWYIEKSDKRIRQLMEQHAPSELVQNELKSRREMIDGTYEVEGDKSLLNVEFNRCDVVLGKSGSEYLQFDDEVNFFPSFKGEKFITKQTRGLA